MKERFTFRYKDRNYTLDCNRMEIYYKSNKLKLNFNKYKSSTLYLKITSNCNMVCNYCFQSNDIKNKNIPILQNYKKLLKNAIEAHDKVVIFGGEPFLRENIENINYLFTFRKKYFFYSNGIFDSTTRKFIIENKDKILKIVISIDGTKNIHNNRKHSSIDSFERIIDNIKILLENSIEVIIQINVDSENINSINNLLDFIVNNFNYKNLKIVLNRVLLRNNDITEFMLLEKFVNLKNKYNSLDLRINSTILEKLADFFERGFYSKERCNIGNTKILDFTTNDIYICPMNYMTNIGGFNKDTVNLNTELIDIFKKKVSEKNFRKCTTCCYKYFCNKGCINDDIINFNTCMDEVESIIQFIMDRYHMFFD